jgi:hypothetical protein
MPEASWLPDPSGGHELRYWNGHAWTEHVSDRGATSVEPPPPDLPGPLDAAGPPPPRSPAAAAAGDTPSWKDRLEQRAERGRRNLAEQQARRTEQEADPGAPPGSDLLELLRGLGELRDDGILTEEEFAAQKAQLLAG